ncbi:MAG: succinate--CoA ligase subunit alpha, partial [Firmicutes bacterium]|nr:succinate--CoA ligase subunit alpha [Bacillota bacterium]
CKIGIMPSHLFRHGPVGLLSRSGTLTYEIVAGLSRAGIGQSTAVGMGGDPIIGMSFVELLELFERDGETEAIVLVGEIGGAAEEEAARYIREHVRKPVVAYVAGRTAPPGKRMGHAGAVISGTEGTAQAKVEALQQVGVAVAELPTQVPELVARALGR